MSRLTEMIYERFGGPVDAMGFADDHPIDSGDYYHFDLNDCQHDERCREDLPKYDAIVFAEVLEHLAHVAEIGYGLLGWYLTRWCDDRADTQRRRVTTTSRDVHGTKSVRIDSRRFDQSRPLPRVYGFVSCVSTRKRSD